MLRRTRHVGRDVQVRKRRGIRRIAATALLAGLAAGACGESTTDPPGPGPSDPPEPSDPRVRFDLRPLAVTPYPPDNPRTAVKVELGRLLFFDPVLAGERDIACATCHHPDFGFADGRARSVGAGGSGLGPGRTPGTSATSGQPIDEMPRNAPTVLNAALNGRGTAVPDAAGFQFWDGRALGLEDQALRPIAARVEMRGDAFPAEVALDSVVTRLRAIPEYVERFGQAFGPTGGGAPDPAGVTAERIGMALATYQRELVVRESPFDRYIAGEDAALTTLELQGLEVFFERAACTQCHFGSALSSFEFEVTGVPPEGQGAGTLAGDDLGREEHTGNQAERYAFRTPALRNVELTAPYMHDGVFATLEDVVRFYSDGARPRHPNVDDTAIAPQLTRPLDLAEAEIAALVAFLRALTDPGIGLPPELVTVPEEVPSGLPPVVGLGDG